MTFWQFPKQTGKAIYINMDQVISFEADMSVKGATTLVLTNGQTLTVAVDVNEIAEKVRKRQGTD